MKTIDILKELYEQDCEKEKIEKKIKSLRDGIGLEKLQIELFKKNIIINYLGSKHES